MSKCSSNITTDSTPLKNKQNLKQNEDLENELIESISSFIEETIQRNKNKKNFSKKTIFYCDESNIPKITLYNYIYYIYSYLNLEISSIILSLISIKRLLERTKDKLSKNNFYKLFITSCFLNSKQNEDSIYSDECFASAGRITKGELFFLEKEYFSMIEYKLFFNDEDYKRYYDFIKNRIKSNRK